MHRKVSAILLAGLKQFHICVQFEDTDDAPSLRVVQSPAGLEVRFGGGEIVFVDTAQLEGTGLDIQALKECHPTLRRVDEYFVYTIQLEFSTFEYLAGSDTSAAPLSLEFSATHLLPLVCKNCDGVIVSALDVSKISCKPLPSEHWIDLADLWVCHPDPESINKPFGVPLEPIPAMGDMILVSKEHFLISQSNLNLQSRTHSVFTTVRCSDCNSVVGSGNEKEIKLMKRFIGMQSNVLNTFYSTEACLCETMLEFCQVNNQRRFVFDTFDGCESIALTILETTALLWLEDRKGWLSARRGIRVIVEDFKEDSQYHSINISQKEFKVMKNVIDKRLHALPTSFSTIAGKNIIFLQRFSI